ncbi:ATP-binding protein [Actinomadura montaniterrae]|uniref:ATP-binding protein n=1 Tax=Actinomadura montaniterrae TaxID=1803903 RepID=A0A6L3VWM1_9ACTN|nr:ATP-binding protein [Actinomadura montaniterrae]KAB2381898.1 ATP-binding protein [Actinomadura montaniterrae]
MSGEHRTIELPSTLATPHHTVPAHPHGLTTMEGPDPVLLGELTLPAERASVPRARAFGRAVLGSAGAAHARDDAEVLISELVTGAVRHAAGTGTLLCLRLLRGGSRLRIEVHDRGAALPHARPVDLMEETGRGWFLVAALADRHGTDLTAAGKTVWCEIGARPHDERHPH